MTYSKWYFVIVFLVVFAAVYLRRILAMNSKFDSCFCSNLYPGFEGHQSAFVYAGNLVLYSHFSLCVIDKLFSVVSKEGFYEGNTLYYKHLQTMNPSGFRFSPHRSLTSASVSYPRHDVSTVIRDQDTDPFCCYYSSEYHYNQTTYAVSQSFKLIAFLGSKRLSEHYTASLYGGNLQDPSEDAPEGITLVSQTTEHRFFFLPIFLKRWNGPIAITMIVQPSNLTSILHQIELLHFPSRVLLTLYIPLHPSHDSIITCRADNTCQRRKETIFPLNRLRNISLRRVKTTHFLLIDMDSWPSQTTYTHLLSLPREYLASPSFVTIVPMFTFHSNYSQNGHLKSIEESVTLVQNLIPESKETLLHDIQEGHLYHRKSSCNHNYIDAEWYQLNVTKPLLSFGCFPCPWLEPYVMLRKSSSIPLFDETFVNYGFNKVQWIEHLRHRGFEFFTSTQAFLVDIPHKKSNYASKYFFDNGNMEMLSVYRAFLYRLQKEPDLSREMLCLR
ncbi:hypothetical protein WA538_003080 [Blastocystis sp. DL]